ncbi:uncharacterized protein LOC110643270 [Hevea brasiliensis]|uniref:uncharacterized protein LOC110643270 n=1 Tax=Hevea brasiliensis TaxID=3981 RepID=UPI0025CC751E|nr:uncharacterized protein LOC110643270 [Hevea brasiliensis]
MNTAFLVKLGWRLLNEEDSLCAWILNDGPLGDFAIQPVPSCIKQLTVAQMWDGQNWKWDMIHCFLPDELQVCLLSNRLICMLLLVILFLFENKIPQQIKVFLWGF